MVFMKKYNKFLGLFVASILAATLVIPVMAATYVGNGEIGVFFTQATRPLIGNIRGITTVSHPYAWDGISNNAIRVRTNGANHNSNGNLTSTTTGVRHEEIAHNNGTIPRGFTHSSAQTIGTSRNGQVIGIGQNRRAHNQAWRGEITIRSQTW